MMKITRLLIVVVLLVQWALACDQSMSYSELRMKGIKAGTDKKLDEAEQCLKLALTKNSTAPDVHHMLGMIYGYQEQWHQAEEHLQEAVRLDPQHLKAWKLLDTVLQKEQGENFLPKLLKVAQNFARLEPDNPEAYAYVGFRAAQGELWDSSLAAFKESYKLAPKNRAYLTNLLTVYATKGWLDEAVPFYLPLMKEDDDSENAQEANLNNVAHYFLLGNVFYAETYIEQAIAFMSSAYERCPSCHVVRFQLGKFLWSKSKLLSKLVGDATAKLDGSALEKTKAVEGMALEQLCTAMYMQPHLKHYYQYLKNISKIDECSRYVDVNDPRTEAQGYNLKMKALTTKSFPLYPIDSVDPPAESWENERCTSRSLSYDRILKEVTPKIPFPTSAPKHYLVNLGAGDGVTNDQLFDLFEFEKHHGLAVEGDPILFKKLEENLPDADVTKVNSYPNTDNVVSIFKKSKVPIEPSLLKLTINGLECPVLETLLDAGYKPTVVVIKINPSIPPPIRFSLQPKDKAFKKLGDAEFKWDGSPYYGCSLSYASDVMKHHGYTLLQLDWVYAVYVKTSWLWRFEGLVHDDFSIHFNGFHGREDRLRCLAFRSSVSNGDPLKGAQMHINYPEMEKWYFELDQDKQVNTIKTFMDSLKQDVPYILQAEPLQKYAESTSK